uniref:CSON015395 protein n=1 Tax=Culicoides sonorensis TaxID=179676 RepID=A0A336MD41_CULSO
MKFLFILALLATFAYSQASVYEVFLALTAKKEVVCYIPEWGPDITSKVDTSLCTMFMISFGTVDSNGNIGLPSNFANFKKLRTANSKLLLALGGADWNSKNAFTQIAASAAKRATFAQNCLNVVKNNGLDGIDIDWEFPDSNERANFVLLHQDVKNKFGTAYLLTTAVSVGQWLVKTNNVYDIAGLAKAVDFINLMAYDMHMDEGWDSSFGVYFNAPVKANSGDSVDQGVNFFLQGGAPASKLTLGVPFYARIYQLSDSSRTAPGSPFVSGYQRQDANKPAYNVYCPKIASSSWTKKRDSLTLCPYMYSGSQWIAYEDEQSIIAKANLANTYNLGGVMLWSLNQDDYDGVCSSCKWPLLKALNSAIGRATSCSGSSGSGGNVEPVIVVPTTQKTVTTTKSSSGGGSSSGTTITTCTSTGLFSYPGDCSKYYNCAWANQAPYTMSCPPGLFFNARAQGCDWSCVAA